MKLIKRKNLFYLGHSFRKEKKVVYIEKYIGKEIPKNIEEIKQSFLRKCLQEHVFKKLEKIRINFQKEWKKYPESIKKKIILDLSTGFTYNSNAIEGSTITLNETEDLIKRKISPNKPITDVQETIRHSKVFFKIINKKQPLSLKMILEWHKELFEETKPDIAGRIRDYIVRVGGYIAPDWQDLKKLLKEFFKWYEQNKVLQPIELAARAHYKFEKIHPFGDGNGRIGRLVIAQILRNDHYPLLIIEYKKRKSYYHALSQDENKFLNYFIRRYLSQYKRYLK
ncbi:MAG: Fic family protein [Nanoarchaeota archaeon]|nr:Fic family protein [DPANN group archaeon]MBL7117152.1 Fic family protein [Nanoarchaeota archaeon]